MRSVSENYLNYINSSLIRLPKSKFVIDNVHYSGEKFLVSYPKVEHKTEKAIGSFPAKTCELEILNRDGTFNLHGKEVTVYRGLEIDGATEWVRIGIFMASDENIKTNINKRTITFQGTDKTQLLDKPYGGKAQWDVSKRILHIVKEICTRNGIELASAEFPMNKYIFPDIPSGLDFENITDRQMIAYIAELGGCIAMFTHNGKLAFKKESETGVTISKSKYKNLSVENAFGPINAISFGHSSYEDSLLFSQDGVTDETRVEWEIKDNPLTSTSDKNNLIQTVSEHFFGRLFVPFEVSDLVDDYIFDLNDSVTIEKKDGSTVNVTLLELATSSRIKSNFKASLQTPGKTKTALSGSVKERLGKVELLVDHQNNKIQSLVNDGEKMQTKITQTNEAVQTQATKIETIEKAGYITESAAKSLIETNNNTIAMTVAGKLSIGTRNILFDSECFESLPVGFHGAELKSVSGLPGDVVLEESSLPSGKSRNIVFSEKPSIEGGISGITFGSLYTIGEAAGEIKRISAGKTYTLSFLLKGAAGTQGREINRLNLIYAGTGVDVNYISSNDLSVSQEWKRYIFTFSFSENPKDFILRFTTVGIPDSVYSLSISSLKLEEGNVATDWTPNVQDIEKSVEAKLELCVKTDEEGNLLSAIHAKANQITIESDNFTLDADGKMTCKGATIEDGSVDIGNELERVKIEDGRISIEYRESEDSQFEEVGYIQAAISSFAITADKVNFFGQGDSTNAEVIVNGVLNSDLISSAEIKTPELKNINANGVERMTVSFCSWQMPGESVEAYRDTIEAAGGLYIRANPANAFYLSGATIRILSPTYFYSTVYLQNSISINSASADGSDTLSFNTITKFNGASAFYSTVDVRGDLYMQKGKDSSGKYFGVANLNGETMKYSLPVVDVNTGKVYFLVN